MSNAKLLLVLSVIGLTGCGVSPERLGISKAKWDEYSKQDQEKMLRNYEYIAKNIKKSTFLAKGDSSLKIGIQNGRALMPPYTDSYAFKGVSIDLKEGTCQAVTLDAVEMNKHTKLYACYNNDILLLDPSPYEIDKRYGSIRIHYSLLWNDGFTYNNINTDGYAHLQNATIWVKKQKLV